MRQTIRLSYLTAEQRTASAQFIAELVRQSVSFTAAETADGVEMVITMTGGY